jgi:dolichol-phosphate mannosyltransferase
MSGQVASESLKKITAWGLKERRAKMRRALSRSESRREGTEAPSRSAS